MTLVQRAGTYYEGNDIPPHPGRRSQHTPAADRGLKPGDVIVEVQQTGVAVPADIQKQVEAAIKADRKNILMLIQREGGVQYVPLALTKAPAPKDKQPG